MLGLLLTFICFSGFVLAVHEGLKIKPAYCPLVSVSFIGMVLYFCAVTGNLKQGAQGLLFVGGVLSLYFGSMLYNSKSVQKIPIGKFFKIFCALVLIAFVLTFGMAFTVIDDFVYWGIIGKYLYIYDHLPVPGNPLDTRILAYTPGTGLIHYFFYVLQSEYSVDVCYFAQALVLISALCVVLDTDDIKKSISYICLLILLMTIFSGSVFTKLQVDYLLSVFGFSIFWIYYNEKDTAIRPLILFLPVCFLFLIKEIGFVLGLFILAMMLADTFADKSLAKKMRTAGLILLTGFGLVLLKKMWASHITAMGFSQFHSAVNLASIKKAVSIFADPAVRKGAFIFIKDIFIGSADRMNLPYAAWYMLIGFCTYKIFNTIKKQSRPRFIWFAGMVLSAFLIYLFMLYCMQIIIFGLGNSTDQTLGFSRYLNIIFSPVVFMAALVFFQRLVFSAHQVSKRVFISVIVVMSLILGISRLEVTLHREKQDIHIQQVSQKIAPKIENGIHSIGVITNKTDNLANLQFLFYLLPNQVDYLPRSFENAETLIEYAQGKEYLLCYQAARQIFDWLEPFGEQIQDSSEVTLFRVNKNTSANGLPFSLERISF